MLFNECDGCVLLGVSLVYICQLSWAWAWDIPHTAYVNGFWLSAVSCANPISSKGREAYSSWAFVQYQEQEQKKSRDRGGPAKFSRCRRELPHATTNSQNGHIGNLIYIGCNMTYISRLWMLARVIIIFAVNRKWPSSSNW